MPSGLTGWPHPPPQNPVHGDPADVALDLDLHRERAIGTDILITGERHPAAAPAVAPGSGRPAESVGRLDHDSACALVLHMGKAKRQRIDAARLGESSSIHSIEKTFRWAPSERSAETRIGMS